MYGFIGKNIFKPYKLKYKNSNFSTSPFNRIRLKERLDTIYIDSPRSLSLVVSTTETIKFINNLQSICDKKKPVFVRMQNLEYLDSSGITVLLSVVNLFKIRGIKFNGDIPPNFYCRETLISSGFFECLKSNKPARPEYTIGKKNQILTKAKTNVDASIGIPIAKSVSNTIWGTPRSLKGLQRVLVELMHNTNNHANLKHKGEKHWWLSINHNHSENKVHFIFLDYGVGIFNSLSQKPKEDKKWTNLPDYISNFFKNVNKSNADLLEELLEGKVHMTVTGKSFRGKGLPGIKEAMDRTSIKNLIIITNNVKANVSDKNYELINKEFNGTFVSWHLDKDCQNFDWTIDENLLK